VLPVDARRRIEILLVAVLWVLPVALATARRRSPPPREAPARAAKPPYSEPRPDSAPKFPLVAFDGQARSPSVPPDPAALDPSPSPSRGRPGRPLRGAVVLRTSLVSPGLNFSFSSSGGEGSALLKDMEGRIVWRWSIEPGPGTNGAPRVDGARLLADGSLLCVLRDRAVRKIDRGSKRVWESRIPAQGELWCDPDGDIAALTRERRIVPEIHPTIPIESDAITILAPDGKVKENISLLDALRRSGDDYLLPRLQEGALDPGIQAVDVLRLNHAEILDGSLASLSPAYAKGNLLFSLGNLSLVGIIDSRTRRIVWLWGPGNLARPRDARMLPNGHVLVFDDRGDSSQVIEVEPRSGSIAWRYAPPDDFPGCPAGTAERLSNGNTLIREADTGYAFEVTRSGKTVWKCGTDDDLGGAAAGMARVDRAGLTFLPR